MVQLFILVYFYFYNLSTGFVSLGRFLMSTSEKICEYLNVSFKIPFQIKY